MAAVGRLHLIYLFLFISLMSTLGAEIKRKYSDK